MPASEWSRTMAAANENNPYELAYSEFWAALLRVNMREYEQGEALAARALKLSEQYQFPQVGAFSRCVLGHARAQLGRASEGIALIRQGLADALKAGTRLPIRTWAGYLATAQEREGAIADALETIEQALQARPRTPEILRLRGELRLKQGRTELAEADFQ